MNYKNQDQTPVDTRPQTSGPAEEGVKIDGLQQIVEMLKHADPAFRESILSLRKACVVLFVKNFTLIRT
jgi:hypothetical protein